jgi:hypothetical protein
MGNYSSPRLIKSLLFILGGKPKTWRVIRPTRCPQNVLFTIADLRSRTPIQMAPGHVGQENTADFDQKQIRTSCSTRAARLC